MHLSRRTLSKPNIRKIVLSVLGRASVKIACYTGLFVILCLPFQSLAAQNAASSIIHNNETWSLNQLPRVRSDIPVANSIYEVFIFSKVGEKWVGGSSLYDPDTELFYVDRRNRSIGPFTSSTDNAGTSIDCKPKHIERQNLRKMGVYGPCRSDFYTADKAGKLLEFVLSCAIVACLGHDFNWNPIFRPNSLKQAILSSNLMAGFASHFQAKDRDLIAQSLITFKTEMDNINYALGSVSKDGNDANALRKSLNEVKTLSDRSQGVWEDLGNDQAYNSIMGRSLGFSLSFSEVNNAQTKARQSFNVTNQSIRSAQKLITGNLGKIEMAERAIVRQIQEVLKENHYYADALDGLFGPGTISAVKALLLDINRPIGLVDKPSVLKTLEGALLEPKGTCPSSFGDGSYVACFSFDELK